MNQSTPTSELTTQRLRLRPLVLSDAPQVQALAGDRRIAEMTLNIPHPYEDGMAEEWISTGAQQRAEGTSFTFAVTALSGAGEVGWSKRQAIEQGVLLGVVGLSVNIDHRRAELGYWVGFPYWGLGIATEAVTKVIDFGFDSLELNRIYATHLTRNPASGRVMEKCGMSFEGLFPEHVMKWDCFEDLKQYGINRDSWSRTVRQLWRSTPVSGYR